MNMAASVVLNEALALAQRFDARVPRRWRDIADHLFIPMGRKHSVILNHDAYDLSEEKGETPEALAAFFPLTYRTDPAIERATTAYYLKLSPRYVGSPMLSALLGVYAARLGDRERAADLFERGYAEFVLEPFHQTSEYHPKVFPEQPRAAPMFACCVSTSARAFSSAACAWVTLARVLRRAARAAATAARLARLPCTALSSSCWLTDPRSASGV